MDLSDFRLTDWLIGGGAVAYLVAMFLPWYEHSGIGSSGWTFFLTGWLPLFLVAFAFVALVLPKLVDALQLPDPLGGLSLGQAGLVTGGAAVVLVLLRLIIASDNIRGIDSDQTGTRGYGLLLALVATMAVASGAYLRMKGKEELGGGDKPPNYF